MITHRRRACMLGAASLASLAVATVTHAQPNFDDGHGKEWLQVERFLNTTWNQIAAVCPTDGATPCAGVVAGTDVTGWVWASQDQVRTLYSLWVPEILSVPTLSGPEYMAVALFFMDSIRPTWEFYTTFGGYLYTAGWTSTMHDSGRAVVTEVSSEYPVFHGYWSVAASAVPTFSSPMVGAWFWRSTAAPCVADLNGDTTADILDFLLFIDAFGTCEGQAAGCTLEGVDPNLVADETIDILDFLEFMDLYGTGCEP